MFEYYSQNICHQDLSKEPQSGYTVDNIDVINALNDHLKKYHKKLTIVNMAPPSLKSCANSKVDGTSSGSPRMKPIGDTEIPTRSTLKTEANLWRKRDGVAKMSLHKIT